MYDIYRELNDIKLSDFGSKMRRAMRLAVYKLSIGVEADISESNLSKLDTSPYGDTVLLAFLELSIQLRNGMRTSDADAPIIDLYNRYSGLATGSAVRSDIYSILKNLSKRNEAQDDFETLHAGGGKVVVMAGNEHSMFYVAGHYQDDQYGITITPPEEGFRELAFTVYVKNLLTGMEIKKVIVLTSGMIHSSITTFIDDSITLLMDPGIVEVSVVYSSGTLADDVIISTDVCRFGMNEPEGYWSPDEDDFMFYVENAETTIAKYIGEHTIIKLPLELGSNPVKTLGISSFMGTEVENVKIQDGVTTIE